MLVKNKLTNVTFDKSIIKDSTVEDWIGQNKNKEHVKKNKIVNALDNDEKHKTNNFAVVETIKKENQNEEVSEMKM